MNTAASTRKSGIRDSRVQVECRRVSFVLVMMLGMLLYAWLLLSGSARDKKAENFPTAATPTPSSSAAHATEQQLWLPFHEEVLLPEWNLPSAHASDRVNAPRTTQPYGRDAQLTVEQQNQLKNVSCPLTEATASSAMLTARRSSTPKINIAIADYLSWSHAQHDHAALALVLDRDVDDRAIHTWLFFTRVLVKWKGGVFIEVCVDQPPSASTVRLARGYRASFTTCRSKSATGALQATLTEVPTARTSQPRFETHGCECMWTRGSVGACCNHAMYRGVYASLTAFAHSTLPATFSLASSDDWRYKTLKPMFESRGAIAVAEDKDAAIVWVGTQRCDPRLRLYVCPQYQQQLFADAVIGTIPGSCEHHYNKDGFCDNVQQLPSTLDSLRIHCFRLPSQRPLLEKHAASDPTRRFVSKALATASAYGMRILTSAQLLAEVSSFTGSGLVQEYVTSPYLVDNRKTDLRVFVYVRTDPARVYVHRDGWVWVAQRAWDLDSQDPYVHFTNRAGVAPGESEKLRRSRRLSILHFVQKHGLQKQWPAFWEKVKLTVAAHVMSFLPKENCEVSTFQSHVPHQFRRCNGYMNLYGVDVSMDEHLEHPRVYEINNDPGTNAVLDLDDNEPNDPPKKRMYYGVYGDVMSIMGVNGSSSTFHRHHPVEEVRNRGGFELAYPCTTKLCSAPLKHLTASQSVAERVQYEEILWAHGADLKPLEH